MRTDPDADGGPAYPYADPVSRGPLPAASPGTVTEGDGGAGEGAGVPDVRDPAFSKLISGGPTPAITAGTVHAARPEPPVRGERLLLGLERLFARVRAFAGRAVPEALNPFAQLGAVANVNLVVALGTGVLLLFWYVPSVQQAYASVAGMEAAPLAAGLLRSLHRYSSDACMLFVLLHGLQVLGARKVGGARWLAWVSGLAMVWLVWLDGWTGYWLVWDERARQVALGSARFLDALPIFPDPVTRSFLTDQGLNSLFFFVVFFVHMLIPLALGAGLWVHVIRLNRARIFTGRALSAAIVLALVVVSVLFPAASAGPARMGVVPQGVAVDGYYLLPLFLADRLQGGVLWGVALLAGVVLFSAPWWLARRRSVPAVVDEARCNGCTQCYQDCPFDAITLLPREGGGGPDAVVARVDPLRCTGCGICVGACDSGAIDQARLPAADVRRWLNRQADDGGGGRLVAFVCAASAGADLRLDARGESEALPGYRVVPVPCTGWVHMLTVERALRRGAQGVLLVGCGPDPACRTGDRWTADRLAGAREPALRTGRVDPARVRHVRYDRTEAKAFFRAAAAFREGRAGAEPPGGGRRLGHGVAAAAVVAGLGVAVLLGGRVPYRPAAAETAELVVSFKHAGQLVDASAAPAEARDDLLPHMRGAVSTERVRVPVRLSVSIDGREVVNRAYEPGGLFDDGSSVAMERIPVPEGRRRVAVRVGDTGRPGEWTYTDERVVVFERGERRVVLFDRLDAFSWH